MIILKVLIILLFADFITGFFHFLLDQYGSPKSRFFKNAIKINLAHHDDPRKMTERSYWELTKDSWKLAIVIIALLTAVFGFHWELILLLFFGANTNIVHKWSHMTKQDRPYIATVLQKLHLTQNKHQHALHHRRPFDSNFCILTHLCNPFLERIHFWKGVVNLLKVFGIKPVAGTEVRNHV